jgi:general stress protein YciG
VCLVISLVHFRYCLYAKPQPRRNTHYCLYAKKASCVGRERENTSGGNNNNPTERERERGREGGREGKIMAKPFLLNHKNNPGEEEVVVDAPNNPKEIFSSLIQRCENLTSFLDES